MRDEPYFKAPDKNRDPADLAVPGDQVQCLSIESQDARLYTDITTLRVGRYYRVEKVVSLTESGTGYLLFGVPVETTSGYYGAWRFRVVRKADPDFAYFLSCMERDSSADNPIFVQIQEDGVDA